MEYKVTLISKDDHKFIFSTEAEAEMEAINNAYRAINNNGWEHYNYVLDDVEKIKKD